ncbi:MFS transporter [Pseudonocardia halophobica]|uniref:MFS transporter n=1 Tax=Pseudonocardia halophobica TaxID=29401 RepID=UPI003D8FD35B
MRSAPTTRSAWQVVGASTVGTSVEYYDFFIYGTAAALVFPHVFFPEMTPVLGALSAFLTFGAGYLARPLGGIVIGHFGDTVGRKRMLVLTVLLMGGATLAIGLLPGYAQIGVAAPILLLVLRLVQGFAFGGEYGGAIIMAFEFAPEGRRGLFASLPHTGQSVGVLLGSAAFALVGGLPEEQLLTWGWRVPFLASIVLVAVGLVIRLKVTETPSFRAARRDNAIVRSPFVSLLRHHRREVLLVAGTFTGFSAASILAITYMVGYARTAGGVPAGTVLTAVTIATAVQLVTTPLSGWLSDRFGRVLLLCIGAAGTATAVSLMFAAVASGRTGLVVLAYVLGWGVFFAAGVGVLPALFSDAFDTSVRFSGMGLGYQLATVLGSAISPTVATLLLGATGTSISVSVYVMAILAIALACGLVLARRVGSAAASTTGEVRTPDRVET